MHSDEMIGDGRIHRLAATSETVHTGFYDASLKPTLTIGSGDIVSLETKMLLDGRLRPGMTIEDLIGIRAGYVDQGFSSHSLTGPIYVVGAEPGDTLEIRILRMVPQPYGVNFLLPGSAGAGTLPEEYPEGRVKSFEWSEGAEHLPFASGIRVPLRPFLGSMAVAPAASGRVSAVPPGPYGGNLDLKELSEGATLYLPVFVSGGLFSAGDAHAVQGDGEVNTSAVETAMREALLQFVLRKDLKLQLPMAETPTHWIAMGFHQQLDEAARIALRQAVAWLVQNRGLSREDAYSLCSLAVDMRITQLVNREKGVHAMIPKGIFTS